MTVASWGLYGIFLHMGQMGMKDPVNGRYKAFLMVGVAYVLVAVLAPAAMMIINGSDWKMPFDGWTRSLIAGGVLLAFGAKGQPAVVMSIIFAGAPVVNAVVGLTLHPPKGGFSGISWQFYAGILLAACGGMLVMLYKPAPAAAAQPAAVEPASSQGAGGD